jgi:hypothetical protein
VRLAGLFALLAVAGCREAPRRLATADLQGDWIQTGDSVEFREIGWYRSTFTIRGDSMFNPLQSISARIDPSWAQAWEMMPDTAWSNWSLARDTLTRHLDKGEWERYERLPTRPRARRPERIAIRFGGCFMGCPVMDAEIDTSGTFWVLEGDDTVPLGRFVAHGRHDLYDRLSTLAAGLRLDLPHQEVSFSYDALSTLLVAWYDGEPHVFDGTADEFGPLLLIVAEMADAAWTEPMEETSVRHRFASRDALDYPFLSHPEVVREVLGE